MRKILSRNMGLWLLLGPMLSFAQIDSIRLPKGEETLNISNIVPTFNIYVDADNTVFLGEEPIELHLIVKTLAYYRYKLPEHLKLRATVFLYIDEQAAYSTVDEIKTQLASAYFERIYYKTNSIADKDILKGLRARRRPSFFIFHFLRKVRTDKQIEKDRRYNDSLRKLRNFDSKVKPPPSTPPVPPPPAPPASWYGQHMHKIYSDNQAAIDEALADQNFSCALLTNEGFKTESDLITLDDSEGLDALFQPKTIVFIRFDKALTYGNYIKALQHYRHMEIKNRGYFIELSHEIVDIHNRSQIRLCD